jgi:hypothetical protein
MAPDPGCDAGVPRGSATGSAASRPKTPADEAPKTSSFPAPIHRYSFDGVGTRVTDSVGHADATIYGAQLAGDGTLVLDSSAGAYVELAPELLSQETSVTLELWFTWRANMPREAETIFDFGNTRIVSGSQSVVSSLSLRPNDGAGGPPVLNLQARSGDPTRVVSSLPLSAQTKAHLAVVLNGRDRTASLYIDAKLAGRSPLTEPLSELDDSKAWLGRAQRPEDPRVSGTFDEFRIYDAALSADDLARSRAKGPSKLP